MLEFHLLVIPAVHNLHTIYHSYVMIFSLIDSGWLTVTLAWSAVSVLLVLQMPKFTTLAPCKVYAFSALMLLVGRQEEH